MTNKLVLDVGRLLGYKLASKPSEFTVLIGAKIGKPKPPPPNPTT
jgi:hypothetical protein